MCTACLSLIPPSIKASSPSKADKMSITGACKQPVRPLAKVLPKNKNKQTTPNRATCV